jgi:two-component system nitrate/nitrite response regulator NarL
MSPAGQSSAYRRPSIRVRRFTSGLPSVLVLHEGDYLAEVLRLLLAGQAEMVGSTRSGLDAVGLSELLVPDVVVTGDVVTDGVADYYIPALLQTGARVLLVTAPCGTERMLHLVALGVLGVVDTDQPPEVLADAVLTLAGGGAVLSPEVVAEVAAGWRRARRDQPGSAATAALTRREVEILGAMSDGLSAKAIAHHLGISLKTVENHKGRIFDKLGVRTQAQAVALAMGNPTLTLPVEQRTPSSRRPA